MRCFHGKTGVCMWYVLPVCCYQRRAPRSPPLAGLLPSWRLPGSRPAWTGSCSGLKRSSQLPAGASQQPRAPHTPVPPERWQRNPTDGCTLEMKGMLAGTPVAVNKPRKRTLNTLIGPVIIHDMRVSNHRATQDTMERITMFVYNNIWVENPISHISFHTI